MLSFNEIISKGLEPVAKKREGGITASVNIMKVNAEKKIVYGEVYAPEIIDAHGHTMSAEEVEKMAHLFLLEKKTDSIDIMHNNKPAKASAVESFIAREGDTEFTPGSWVVATKIFDDELWEEIKTGKYNGYSMEILVEKHSAIINMQVENHVFGITEENDGHDHIFYVQVNDEGTVVKGYTSEDDGHMHEISMGTATSSSDNHKHRYFLP